MRKSILLCVFRCVYQDTHLPLAPSLSFLWSRWAAVSWLSLPVAQRSPSTRQSNLTIQVIPPCNTRSCRTQQAPSSPIPLSVKLLASLLLWFASSSTQSRPASTTSQPNSCSTILLPTCSKCFYRGTVTVHKWLWKMDRSFSLQAMLVSRQSRSSLSRTSHVSPLSTNGEFQRNTEMRSISNQQGPFWCQTKPLRSKPFSLL